MAGAVLAITFGLLLPVHRPPQSRADAPGIVPAVDQHSLIDDDDLHAAAGTARGSPTRTIRAGMVRESTI
jgi:hypothetical protein